MSRVTANNFFKDGSKVFEFKNVKSKMGQIQGQAVSIIIFRWRNYKHIEFIMLYKINCKLHNQKS